MAAFFPLPDFKEVHLRYAADSVANRCRYMRAKVQFSEVLLQTEFVPIDGVVECRVRVRCETRRRIGHETHVTRVDKFGVDKRTAMDIIEEFIDANFRRDDGTHEQQVDFTFNEQPSDLGIIPFDEQLRNVVHSAKERVRRILNV